MANKMCCTCNNAAGQPWLDNTDCRRDDALATLEAEGVDISGFGQNEDCPMWEEVKTHLAEESS